MTLLIERETDHEPVPAGPGSRRRLAHVALNLYPPSWREDGRVEEIAEILDDVVSSGRRRDAALEVFDVARQALAAQVREWAPASVRRAIGLGSLITGTAFSVIWFVFGEWTPWQQIEPWTAPTKTFGPFTTTAAPLYLLWVVLAISITGGARRLTYVLGFLLLPATILAEVNRWIEPELQVSAIPWTALTLSSVGVLFGLRELRGLGRVRGLVPLTIVSVATVYVLPYWTDKFYFDRTEESGALTRYFFYVVDKSWELAEMGTAALVVAALLCVTAIATVRRQPAWAVAAAFLAGPWTVMGLARIANIELNDPRWIMDQADVNACLLIVVVCWFVGVVLCLRRARVAAGPRGAAGPRDVMSSSAMSTPSAVQT